MCPTASDVEPSSYVTELVTKIDFQKMKFKCDLSTYSTTDKEIFESWLNRGGNPTCDEKGSRKQISFDACYISINRLPSIFFFF